MCSRIAPVRASLARSTSPVRRCSTSSRWSSAVRRTTSSSTCVAREVTTRRKAPSSPVNRSPPPGRSRSARSGGATAGRQPAAVTWISQGCPPRRKLSSPLQTAEVLQPLLPVCLGEEKLPGSRPRWCRGERTSSLRGACSSPPFPPADPCAGPRSAVAAQPLPAFLQGRGHARGAVDGRKEEDPRAARPPFWTTSRIRRVAVTWPVSRARSSARRRMGSEDTSKPRARSLSV